MAEPSFADIGAGRQILGTAREAGTYPVWMPDHVVSNIQRFLRDGTFRLERLPQPWLFSVGGHPPYDIVIYVSEGFGGQIDAEVARYGPYSRQYIRGFAKKTGIPEDMVIRLLETHKARIYHYIFQEGYSIEIARQAVREDAARDFKKSSIILLDLLIDAHDIDLFSLQKPFERVTRRALRRSVRTRRRLSIPDGIEELGIHPRLFGDLFEHPTHVRRNFPEWIPLDVRAASGQRTNPFRIYDYLSGATSPNTVQMINVASTGGKNVKYLLRKLDDLFGKRPYTFRKMKESLEQMEADGLIRFQYPPGHNLRDAEILSRSKLCVPIEQAESLKTMIRDTYQDYSDEMIAHLHKFQDGTPDSYYEFFIRMTPSERETFMMDLIIGMDVDWNIIASLL